ncbi:MAG: FkbM family methyltransferase [Magnetococcales bacterium]|nr:FkbM family methyltransferase [Magnetococcales bacterium]
MSHANIIDDPRMTRHLIAQGRFRDDPLRIIDVGARYGAEDHWVLFGDQAHILGFEADAEEAERLNALSHPVPTRYYPVALFGDQGEHTFYLTRFNASCGFYRYDPAWWTRLGQMGNVAVTGTTTLDTVDLDGFLKDAGSRDPDFMKLDVEGAELDILQAGTRTLNSVIGLSLETFFGPVLDQPPFHRVDGFLQEQGFELFDLDLKRFRRTVLPEISPFADEHGNPVSGPSRTGQVVSADLLYLRDAVTELEREDVTGSHPFWNRSRLLKLAALYEIHGLQDCAIELLTVASRRKLLAENEDLQQLLDLATPLHKGEVQSYESCLKRVKEGDDPYRETGSELLWRGVRLWIHEHLPAAAVTSLKSTLASVRRLLKRS